MSSDNPSLEHAFSLLERFTNLERGSFPIRELRLDRMRALLELFGNPERSFISIHVAGSKGKGSTSRCIASIMDAAGMPCGLYTSPHVESYTERIGRAGTPFPDRTYIEAITEMLDRIESLPSGSLPGGEGPTTFELLTLLAFLLFRRQGLPYAVIETGIGGRLDATNVILPAASVLTPVEREHTEYLGETVPLIASEKAGIMKPGVPAFSSRQTAEVEHVFRTAARDRPAPFRYLPEELSALESETTIGGTRFRLQLRDGFEMEASLPMIGAHQAENAALAILTLHRLFPDIDRGAFRRGLASASLPGRFEIVRTDPPIVLDAAHTPGSIARVLDSFEKLFPEPGILLFGSVAGKDPAAMASLLAGRFRTILITTPGTFKRSDPAEVYRIFQERDPSVRLIPDPGEALEQTLSYAGGSLPVLITGSFYLVGEARRRLRSHGSTVGSGVVPEAGGSI